MAITRVVSFDPASYRNLGWAVVDYDGSPAVLMRYETGTYVTPKEYERYECLPFIHDFVKNFVLEKLPQLVIIEQTSAFKGSFITAQVAQCIGVMTCVCLQSKLPIAFVSPSHSKLVVVGKGKCTKSEMQKSAEHVLQAFGAEGKIKFDSEHCADALGNIFCHLSDTGVFQLPAPLFTKPKKSKKKDKDNG